MALYDDSLKKAAVMRGQGQGTDTRLIEARKRLAALQASGLAMNAQPGMGNPMPGVPTPQMRNVAGQFGTGMGMQNRYQQAADLRGQGDTVPAMLSPGEAVIPAQQAAALARAGLLDDATGVPQKHMADQLRYRDAAVARGAVLGFQTGGVVPGGTATPTAGSPAAPTFGTPSWAQMGTAPPKQAIEPQTGFQAPQIAPQGPGQPTTGLGQPQYQTQYQGLPQFSEELQGRIRAQESQRLSNIERARLSELGSAAASSGAILGGDVKQLAAQINAERIQAEAELGTNLAVQAFQMQREDAGHLLDDQTRRYMADLSARTALEVARLENPEPSTLTQILDGAGQIGRILNQFGVTPQEAISFLGKPLANALGIGGNGTNGALEGARGPYGTGGGATGGTGGTGGIGFLSGGPTGLGVAGSVGAGAFGAYELAHSWGGTGGVGQAALGGAGVGFAVGGPVGAAIGAGIGALGEIAGIGPSDERIRRDAFTKLFDGINGGLQSSGSYNLPATDPNSYWNPVNRAAVAQQFRTAAGVDATQGSGISTTDWQRIRGMGLAEYMTGSNGRAGWFLMDDPRLIAIIPGGKPFGESGFSIKINAPIDSQPDAGLRRDSGASLANLMQRGVLEVRTPSGELVNFNDPTQLARLIEAAGNAPRGSAAAPAAVG